MLPTNLELHLQPVRVVLRRHLHNASAGNRDGVLRSIFLENPMQVFSLGVHPGSCLGQGLQPLLLSPALGYPLLLLRYIGVRAHPLWYWRLIYNHVVGNGEGFRYIRLYEVVCDIVQGYSALKQTDFSPHCDFQPINSFTY